MQVGELNSVQLSWDYYSLKVRNRMPRCSVTEYLNISGSTTNSTRQPNRHSCSVLSAILCGTAEKK